MSGNFTKEEVLLHSNPADLWIIVAGKAYDVTKWQYSHPGGSSILRAVGGSDATKLFKRFHNVDAFDRASEPVLMVGTVTESKKDRTTEFFEKWFKLGWRKKAGEADQEGQSVTASTEQTATATCPEFPQPEGLNSSLNIREEDMAEESQVGLSSIPPRASGT